MKVNLFRWLFLGMIFLLGGKFGFAQTTGSGGFEIRYLGKKAKVLVKFSFVSPKFEARAITIGNLNNKVVNMKDHPDGVLRIEVKAIKLIRRNDYIRICAICILSNIYGFRITGARKPITLKEGESKIINYQYDDNLVDSRYNSSLNITLQAYSNGEFIKEKTFDENYVLIPKVGGSSGTQDDNSTDAMDKTKVQIQNPGKTPSDKGKSPKSNRNKNTDKQLWEATQNRVKNAPDLRQKIEAYEDYLEKYEKSEYAIGIASALDSLKSEIRSSFNAFKDSYSEYNRRYVIKFENTGGYVPELIGAEKFDLISATETEIVFQVPPGTIEEIQIRIADFVDRRFVIDTEGVDLKQIDLQENVIIKKDGSIHFGRIFQNEKHKATIQVYHNNKLKGVIRMPNGLNFKVLPPGKLEEYGAFPTTYTLYVVDEQTKSSQLIVDNHYFDKVGSNSQNWIYYTILSLISLLGLVIVTIRYFRHRNRIKTA